MFRATTRPKEGERKSSSRRKQTLLLSSLYSPPFISHFAGIHYSLQFFSISLSVSLPAHPLERQASQSFLFFFFFIYVLARNVDGLIFERVSSRLRSGPQIVWSAWKKAWHKSAEKSANRDGNSRIFRKTKKTKKTFYKYTWQKIDNCYSLQIFFWHFRLVSCAAQNKLRREKKILENCSKMLPRKIEITKN